MSEGVNRAGSNTPANYSPDTPDTENEKRVEARIGNVKRMIAHFEAGAGPLRASRQNPTPWHTKKTRPLHERNTRRTDKIDPALKPALKKKPTKSQIEQYNQQQNRQKAIQLENNKTSGYTAFSPASPNTDNTPAGEPVYMSPGHDNPYDNSEAHIYDSLTPEPVYESVGVSLENQKIRMNASRARRNELPEHYQAFWPNNHPLPGRNELPGHYQAFWPNNHPLPGRNELPEHYQAFWPNNHPLPGRNELPEHYQAFWPSNRPLQPLYDKLYSHLATTSSTLPPLRVDMNPVYEDIHPYPVYEDIHPYPVYEVIHPRSMRFPFPYMSLRQKPAGTVKHSPMITKNCRRP